ncbi:MAG: dTDP-glucose 4,6-dehydratase [Geminicoccaceae bacterium]|jgi:secreted PhoX family phosphatase|nr:MAG: dTDP-glucose 4,6-dehydratase [Geminicoccaceae bacterium]
MDVTNPRSRAQAFDASEDIGRNPSDNPTIGEVIAARFNRRDLMRGILGTTAIAATLGPLALAAGRQARAASTASFVFEEVPVNVGPDMMVAKGHRAQVLIRWGDPVLAGAPPFDPYAQSAEKQARQFGYNNDYIGYLPIDGSSEHGLLCINHEYTNEELMFPGLGGRQDTKEAGFAKMTPELARIEMMAHGGTVLEVKKEGGSWRVIEGSRYARRITAETPMEITGPAAGHERMRTSADPTGTRVLGMLNNCAGGRTPWGTWLSCEENFHGYFRGKLPEGHPEAANHKRYGVPGGWYNWGAYESRFDVGAEPNEANRFGWVVEIDPFDPTSTPKKRTALGRFKHEGAAGIVNKDGRYVIYQGDDERFEYIYRFVTEAKVDLANPKANADILDRGTLSVARFNPDGSLDWLPLVHGHGPLTEANGFRSQADVVIEARRAADLLGATKMDRPEDVEANPKTQKVYAMLTNNTRRKADQVDAANPRPENVFGHIIEMIPPDGDHAADRFRWDILVRCGDHRVASVGATFHAATSEAGWFGMPDNCAIDSAGRLWIATDGNSPKASGRNDGLWSMETEGELRGLSRHFFSCPIGAELCGPEFTPDGRTLFVAIQHPGEEDLEGNSGTFENPPTRWPDFKEGWPPRPSIVVITKEDGGVIAS